MIYKKRPMRPEKGEEIVKYKKLGLIFVTHNSFLDSYSQRDAGLSAVEAVFCKKHKLGTQNYLKIKSAFARNGKQSVVNIFKRNKLKPSKCEEVVQFLVENTN